jgi:hypothetical protein
LRLLSEKAYSVRYYFPRDRDTSCTLNAARANKNARCSTTPPLSRRHRAATIPAQDLASEPGLICYKILLIEIAKEFIETVLGGEKFILVAQMIFAKLPGRITKRLE